MRILVIRFSAMGDVALVAPVLQSVLAANENLEITMLSRPFFAPFFEGIERLVYRPADVDRAYKGVAGLHRLYGELKSQQFDVIVDLHDHLRSRVLCTFFRASGGRIVRFDKGRKEKKALIKQGPGNAPLIHTTERYLQAFERVGIKVYRPLKPLSMPVKESPRVSELLADIGSGARLIGIAPFAKHPEKVWPVERMIETMELVGANHPESYFFLFGGGGGEVEKLKKIKAKIPTSRLVAGLLELREELMLIARLDVMVSMDSANMHMAALVGTKVISIWGPTHPHAGFGPLFNEDLMIQSSKVGRPYTIYGKSKNSKIFSRSVESMDAISSDDVYKVIRKILD